MKSSNDSGRAVAIEAAELLDGNLPSAQELIVVSPLDDPIISGAGYKPPDAAKIQMTPEKRTPWIKYTMAVLLAFAVFFGRSIYDSDFYQRNFNTAQWAEKQRKNAEFFKKLDELNRLECAIMLHAKAELIPIEIERNKLYGMSDADAAKDANNTYNDEVELCKMLDKN